MNETIKKIGAVALAGAAAGFTGAVAVDWAEFKKYLTANDFGGAFKHLKLFNWGAALPRYWRGIYGGAIGAVLGYFGLDQFGIGIGSLGA